MLAGVTITAPYTLCLRIFWILGMGCRFGNKQIAAPAWKFGRERFVASIAVIVMKLMTFTRENKAPETNMGMPQTACVNLGNKPPEGGCRRRFFCHYGRGCGVLSGTYSVYATGTTSSL